MSALKVFLDAPKSAKIPWVLLYVGVDGDTSSVPTDELVKVRVIQLLQTFELQWNLRPPPLIRPPRYYELFSMARR